MVSCCCRPRSRRRRCRCVLRSGLPASPPPLPCAVLPGGQVELVDCNLGVAPALNGGAAGVLLDKGGALILMSCRLRGTKLGACQPSAQLTLIDCSMADSAPLEGEEWGAPSGIKVSSTLKLTRVTIDVQRPSAMAVISFA